MKNSECTKYLLKLCCKEKETNTSTIKDLDFSSIKKITSDMLECFLRVRVEEDLTDKWKFPAKGNGENLDKEKGVHRLYNHF